MIERIPRQDPPVLVVKSRRRPVKLKPAEPPPAAWPFAFSSRGWHRRDA